jgi:hypothetical protein
VRLCFEISPSFDFVCMNCLNTLVKAASVIGRLLGFFGLLHLRIICD